MQIDPSNAGWLCRRSFYKAKKSLNFIVVMALSALFCSGLRAQTPVLTQHNNNSRTGAYTTETILTPANVNKTSFGKLFSYPVDGRIYAQPLYVPGLAISAKVTPNLGSFPTTNA